MKLPNKRTLALAGTIILAGANFASADSPKTDSDYLQSQIKHCAMVAKKSLPFDDQDEAEAFATCVNNNLSKDVLGYKEPKNTGYPTMPTTTDCIGEYNDANQDLGDLTQCQEENLKMFVRFNNEAIGFSRSEEATMGEKRELLGDVLRIQEDIIEQTYEISVMPMVDQFASLGKMFNL